MFPTRATRVLQQAYVVSMQFAFMSTQLAMNQPLPHRGTATASDELPAGSARALPLQASEPQEEFGNGLRRIACGPSSCSTTTSVRAPGGVRQRPQTNCLRAQLALYHYKRQSPRRSLELIRCTLEYQQLLQLRFSLELFALEAVLDLFQEGCVCVCHPLYQRVVTSSDKLQQYCKNIAGGSGFQ